MARTPIEEKASMTPDAKLIDKLADDKLGVANQQAAQQHQAQQDAMAQAVKDEGTAAKTDEAKPTPSEQAAEAVSPTTEGDKQKEESFIKVQMGDSDADMRTLSEKQIKDTYKRYSDLNYMHQTQVAPMKPVLDFANQIAAEVAKDGTKVKADDIVQFLSAASQAYMKNPTMGGQKDPTPDSMGIPLGEIEKDMAKWEEENAISLPPKYKEAAGMLQTVMNDNANLKKMVQNIANQSQGLAQNTQAQVKAAGDAQTQAMRQMAANNLNQAQAKYQLPDDMEQKFFDFAFGRGYTVEDFIDPSLTDQVVSDFKNNVNSPEMARLQDMAKRRQSFTGTIGATPGAVGEAPKPNADEEFISKVAQGFMKKRNMG
tara:strand:- start:31499 stop:32611 length:1113 start_codon:yes stop_codon:yes gene_type:complete